MQVQLGADAAGWRKNASNPLLKNFSAFVVKVVHKQERVQYDEEGNEVIGPQRVGDAVNSLHNNKLGLLYSGKDSYELLQKYFTSQQDADTPSILQQLDLIQQEGVQLPAGQEEQPAQSVGVKYLGGGDGKFQSEQGGLNGHAGTYPCGRCECHKSYLHLKKADLQQRCPDLQRRSLVRCRMLAHKWGESFALTEPYTCPGCGSDISAGDRHLPQLPADVKEYPRLHFGQYPDRHPLLPVEVWDFIPDLLQAQLRSVINMFFATISMNIHSQHQAKELCTFMELELKVTATPVWSQGSRETTVKTLQTWNGEECRSVLRGVDRIISQIYPDQGSRGHNMVSAVWTAWKELYAVLIIEDVAEDKWDALATIVDSKAAEWHTAFLNVTDTQDVTPTMHEIVCHYGDFIRMHGPLGPYSSDGLEARHQPIKRMCSTRTNRHGFNARGVKDSNTDIVQVMRRTCAMEHVQLVAPRGKGAKKVGSTPPNDSLSAYLTSVQIPVLVELGMLSAEDVDTLLAYAI